MRKAALLIAMLVACASDPPAKQTAEQYFTRNPYVVMSSQCAGNTSGCHTRNYADPYATGPAPFMQSTAADSYSYLIDNGFTGSFDDQAPLLAPQPLGHIALDQDALDTIDHWFALERQERGL